jgi:hypothetical protein
MDCAPSLFEKLVHSVGRVARHNYYPGKEQAIDQCVEDIADLTSSGRITVEQGEALREILLGCCSPTTGHHVLAASA